MSNRKLHLSIRFALAFGGAAMLGLSSAVLAQDQDDADDAGAEPVERMQVTGSRIRRDDLDSPTPIDVIMADVADEQGITTLGELLRTATVASGSNQLISAMSVGFVTAGGAGNESISMRGLGANRTLVLLNGRRAGPAGTRGQVAAFDFNALPISIVDRIEILKDGASSLYGSDAVAGVINIITKKGDDSSINASMSRPFDSGGENHRINATWGRTHAAGSFRIVADYNADSELKRGDRNFFACTQRYLFDAVTGERADPIDPRTGDYHCNDLPYGMWLWNAGASNYLATINSFDYDGHHAAAGRAGYTPIEPGDISTPPGWFPVGYDKESDGWLDASHPFVNRQTMDPKQTRASLYGQGDYAIGNSTSLYGEALFTRRETTINSYRQFWEPFIPAWAGLVEGWDGNVYLDPTTVTDHSGSKTTVDYTRFVVGAEGRFGRWDYDVSYQRSMNRGRYRTKIIHEDALVMAADAIWGDPCEGHMSPISNLPCYEVPFFDPEYLRGNHDQGTRDFLFGMDKGKTIYNQDTLDGYITGNLFDMPAGPVGVAFGAAFQRDYIKDTPGFNTRHGNSWGLTSAGVTTGRSRTTAVYGEAQLPLLSGLTLADKLDLTLSSRWTDVNTYGDDTTYKASLNWSLTPSFRIRSSYGTSFRAPALFELFLEDQTSFFSQQNDPCWNWGAGEDAGTLNPRIAENCAADGIPRDYQQNFGSGTLITAGGAGTLEAETSVSKGIGAVWHSPADVWAFSVDYYEVDIDDQVSTIGSAEILSLCYASENFANEPFCDLFDRNDGTGGNYNITELRGGYVNIAEQHLRGVDYRGTYRNSFSFGDLRVRWDHTMTIKRYVKNFPDSPTTNLAGLLGNPKHSGTLTATLDRNDWSFHYALRYYDKVSNARLFEDGNESTYRGTPVTFVADIPRTFYHTLSIGRQINNFDVTLGVNNLFDKKPPKISPVAGNNVGNSALYSQYDYVGRRVFLNVGYNF